MAEYRKLSEYYVNTYPNDDDLVPSIITNADGTLDNALIPYAVLKGKPGEDGQDGVGVPTGGSTGQVLSKTSNANHDTSWVTLNKTSMGLNNVDNTSDEDKPVSTAVQAAIDAAVAQTKKESYPIGSLYFNAVDSTNPASLLGFGTWSAYAEGRVPVGKAPSGTFATAGDTGGAETHTLSMSEIPNATGAMTAHSSMSAFWGPNGVFSSSTIASTYARPGTSTSGANSVNILRFNLGGGGQAHNNLQPYITVYIWRRTA